MWAEEDRMSKMVKLALPPPFCTSCQELIIVSILFLKTFVWAFKFSPKQGNFVSIDELLLLKNFANIH